MGGHCIPVYPHFLLAAPPSCGWWKLARAVNDGQAGRAISTLGAILGELAGCPVLVLGITYREGVKELAYSRALALIDELRAAGADVCGLRPAHGARGDRGAGAPAVDAGASQDHSGPS